MSYLTNKSVPAVAGRVKREAINMRFNALSFIGTKRFHPLYLRASNFSPQIGSSRSSINKFILDYFATILREYIRQICDTAYFKFRRITRGDKRRTDDSIRTSTNFVEHRFVPDFGIVNPTIHVERGTEFARDSIRLSRLRLVKFARISSDSRNFKEINWNSFRIRWKNFGKNSLYFYA